MRKTTPSYQQVYRLESSSWWKKYWWRQGRDFIVRLFLKRFLPPGSGTKILDVGCGLGETSQKLTVFGQVIGIDSSAEAIKLARQNGLKTARVMNATRLSFPNQTFGAATALDVLEHLKNDDQAIREIFRVLKNQGLFLLTVPAYDWLWSEHDQALGHQRRYAKKEIEAKLKAAGFTILRSSFIISFFLPPIAFFRFWQKLFQKKKAPQTSYVILPNWFNFLLAGVLKLEGLWLQVFNLPFGVSLICLAQKQ